MSRKKRRMAERRVRRVRRKYTLEPRPVRKPVRKFRAPLLSKIKKADLRKPKIGITQVRREIKKIDQKRVLPVFSRISPVKCSRKRAIARRAYFSYKGSGAGPRKARVHNNRFTVRC